MIRHRYVVAGVLLFFGALVPSRAQDTDRDGLSDELEQALLQQFAPGFMLDKTDCAGSPAEFAPDLSAPKVAAANGTIYGQVFPVRNTAGFAEIHFYHLWGRDCGTYGHALDTEHVSALVQASGSDIASATWKAVYWYAGAHEDTVCDASQITRASTIHAESRGALVWVSTGKHASFLRGELAKHGCGGDALGGATLQSVAFLAPTKVINIGEPGIPMNGALWGASRQWPLSEKMARTDFAAGGLARVDALPSGEIARVNPALYPAQSAIAGGAAAIGALETGRKDTAGAISHAGASTDNALEKSYRVTVRQLSNSIGRVGALLHLR